jgi:hypothetical protein
MCCICTAGLLGCAVGLTNPSLRFAWCCIKPGRQLLLCAGLEVQSTSSTAESLALPSLQRTGRLHKRRFCGRLLSCLHERKRSIHEVIRLNTNSPATSTSFTIFNSIPAVSSPSANSSASPLLVNVSNRALYFGSDVHSDIRIPRSPAARNESAIQSQRQAEMANERSTVEKC